MNNKSITSVTLSDSVEIVRYLAFSYCDNLTKVLISEKTQNIEKNAFLNSRKLADENGLVVINNVLYHCYRNADDITIPAGVTSIESEAFAECTKLQKLIIPNGVKTIGQKAFSGCENLKTVILPQGLVRIDDYAFCDCDINYISIPVGVKSFGKGFLGRSHYYEIEVPTWYSQLTEAVNGADITCIHTEDISSVPAKYRRLAAVGLAHEKEIDKDSKRVKEHFAYIKRNASSLCTTAVEDPELIQLMCDNRLIEERNIDKYIDAVGDAWCHILIMLNKDRDEKVLSILESYKSTLNEERISRENNKEKAAIEGKKKTIRERQAKQDPNSGINGLTFVLSGKMKSWRSRQELVDYLHFMVQI